MIRPSVTPRRAGRTRENSAILFLKQTPLFISGRRELKLVLFEGVTKAARSWAVAGHCRRVGTYAGAITRPRHAMRVFVEAYVGAGAAGLRALNHDIRVVAGVVLEGFAFDSLRRETSREVLHAAAERTVPDHVPLVFGARAMMRPRGAIVLLVDARGLHLLRLGTHPMHVVAVRDAESTQGPRLARVRPVGAWHVACATARRASTIHESRLRSHSPCLAHSRQSGSSSRQA